MAKGAKRGKPATARSATIPAQGMAAEPRLVARWRRMTLWMSVFLAVVAPPLVTFDYGEIATGDAITGKEFLIPFVACLWAAATAGFAAAGLRPRLDWAGWSLLGAGGLALVWIPFSPYPQYTVPVVYSFVTPLAIYFMTAALDERGKETLVKALLIGAALATAVTVIMTLALIGIPKYPYTFYDAYGNKNLYAVFLTATLVLGVYMATATPGNGWRWFAGVLAFLAVAQSLVTFSRGAYMALGVVAIGSLMVFRRRELIMAAGGTVFAAALFLAFTRLGQGRFLTLAHLKSAMATRLEIWDEAGRAFVASPLWGVGPGLFQVHAKDHAIKELFGLRLADAHNDVIQLAVELGAAGLLLFLAPVAWIAWRALRERAVPLRTWAAVGLAGIAPVSMVTSLTIRAGTLSLIMLLAGLAAVQGRSLGASAAPLSRRASAAFLAAALVLAALASWGVLALKEKVQYASLKRVMTAGGGDTGYLSLKAARIADVYPEDPDRSLTQALLALRRGDRQAYLAYAREYADRDPASPLRWLHLGYASLLNGDYGGAERELVDAYYKGASNEATAGLLYVVYTFKGDRLNRNLFYTLASRKKVNGAAVMNSVLELGVRPPRGSLPAR